MQINFAYLHDAEYARQNEGDAKSDDHARANAQTEKTDHEDDNNGFPQCTDKITDRFVDDLRLVRYLMYFHTCGHIALHGFYNLFQIFTELQYVATVFHGSGDAHCRLTVIIHFRIGRFRIRAFDLCNVAQTENGVVPFYGKIFNRFHIFKGTAYTQIDVVRLCIDHTRGSNGILSLHRFGNGRRRNAERREFRIFYFNVYFFRLFTQDFRFTHIRHAEDFPPQEFRFLPQFFIRIPVARHGVNGTVHVIKMVVIIWTVHALRQSALRVFRKVAYFLPHGTHAGRFYIIVKIDKDNRLSRFGIAFNIIQMRRILKLFLNFIRNLFFHLPGRSPGPGNGYDHLPHRIGRIFHPPQFHIRKGARQGDDNDKIPYESLIAQGYLRKITHYASPSVRTVCPCDKT